MTIKKRMISDALQQMTGFHLGRWGGDVHELASSMGLTKEEWDYIKKKENCDLDEDETKEMNKYFEGDST